MRRRPAEMLRRVTPNDEAELRPAGPEEAVGDKISTVEHGSSLLSARGSHANDNERLYDYLVAAGRRGVGAKAIAAKAAKAEAKRLSRNKKQREGYERKRQNECMRTETSGGGNLCEQDWAEEDEEKVEYIEQERSSALSRNETEIYDEVIRNFPMQWPTEQGQGGRKEELEWIEGGDAMEFTIGRVNEKGIEGSEGEH